MSLTFFSKICETIWMTWAFFIIGINYSILGPTLLDLQLILKQDIDTLATIPLSSGIGETSGMFLALALSKYGQKRLQLGISLLLASVVITIIPVVPNFIYVDVMFALSGFISAIPSCFLMDVCSDLWKDKGTSFQFILVGSSLGAILTPLIVEPFLCQDDVSKVANFTSHRFSPTLLDLKLVGVTSVNGSCSMEDLVLAEKMCANVSRHFEANDPDQTQGQFVVDHIGVNVQHTCPCTSLVSMSYISVDCKSSVINDVNENRDYCNWQMACGMQGNKDINSYNTTEGNIQNLRSACCRLLSALDECRANFRVADNGTESCTESDTNVRNAYVAMGFVLLPSSFAFFYFWWKRDASSASVSITEEEIHDRNVGGGLQGKIQIVIFYTVLFLSYFPVTALTITFTTYLTAFGVEGSLQLPKSTMVYMTSVFWISTLLGRIVSTALTPLLGHAKIIIGNFVGLVVASVLLIVVAPYYESMLWLSTVLLGVFACPYEGAGIAWAADYVGMSPQLVALSWISASAGNLAFPFVGGIMFTDVGPSAFLFLLCGINIFMVLMFIMLNIQVWWKGFKIKTEP
ncbi:major facilitator superfamily domain-containing protein 4A-like isoform X1 [Haliotis rufescens]|uniref:major facilitator superfamily domain-containing protein 4A-like isoform X1 n=2 Tax=Haliotis rufescens TaxID=6454 RepID=UPI00201E810E|nr:major facilitator superfamily domain-containing protein 4A-like isoform X1 [Haliotis rufescens]